MSFGKALHMCRIHCRVMLRHASLLQRKVQTSRILHQPCATFFFGKRKIRYQAKYERDGIEADNKLVYVSNMNNYVFGGAAIVPICAFMTTGVSMKIFMETSHLPGFPENIDLDNPIYITPVCLLFAYGLFFATNKFRQQIINRIYYDAKRDLYTAVTLGFFLQSVKVTFKPGDIREIPLRPTTMWANVEINGQRYFILPGDFRLIQYYNHMMGFTSQ